jgi:hypothetical protein
LNQQFSAAPLPLDPLQGLLLELLQELPPGLLLELPPELPLGLLLELPPELPLELLQELPPDLLLGHFPEHHSLPHPS